MLHRLRPEVLEILAAMETAETVIILSTLIVLQRFLLIGAA